MNAEDRSLLKLSVATVSRRHLHRRRQEVKDLLAVRVFKSSGLVTDIAPHAGHPTGGEATSTAVLFPRNILPANGLFPRTFLPDRAANKHSHTKVRLRKLLRSNKVPIVMAGCTEDILVRGLSSGSTSLRLD